MQPRWLRSRSLALLILLILIFLLLSHDSSPSSGDSDDGSINWSRYAYSQYATDSYYLCNSVMLFEALHRLGSRADRILFYPEHWDTEVSDSRDRDSQLLVLARDRYGVKLKPVTMWSLKKEEDSTVKDNNNATKLETEGSERIARAKAAKDIKTQEEETWDYSINKFLAFDLTSYDRVIHIDSDVTLLQHLDELFLLPPTPVAMARAYWELPNIRKLTSLIVVLEPSSQEYEALLLAANNTGAASAKFDMEILNSRYADSALILPHRPYALLTGEFRSASHETYLGNDREIWDPDAVLKEAKLVHFSDWPLPKPWIMWPSNLLSKMLPRCDHDSLALSSGKNVCRDRDVWKGLYDDFRKRRKDICALLSVPAPEWHEKPANRIS